MSVVQKENGSGRLRDFLETHRGEAGIVYCLSRKKVEKTAAALAELGYDALPYHAGLDAATRAENHRRFLRDEGVVIVATIAFGIGIDKPDVRFVAHLPLPTSIDGYYPHPARPARHGEPADPRLCPAPRPHARPTQYHATTHPRPHTKP